MTTRQPKSDIASAQADAAGDAIPRVRPIKRPETLAVALRYESGQEGAPKVTAGGRGAIAEQILEIAFQLGIPVREDPDLAALLNTIDMDTEIPAEAFATVAEILIYVYRANGQLADKLAEADALLTGREEPTAP